MSFSYRTLTWPPVCWEPVGKGSLPGGARGPELPGDIREAGLIPGSGGSPGGGHGNPLKYSCLENPRDRGTWWATVHGVTESRTRLKRLGTHAHVGKEGWGRWLSALAYKHVFRPLVSVGWPSGPHPQLSLRSSSLQTLCSAFSQGSVREGLTPAQRGGGKRGSGSF